MAQKQILSHISRLVVFLVSVVLLSQTQQISAIKCWVCRSDLDPNCADPFDNRTQAISDCNQEKHEDILTGTETVMCRKSGQKANGTWIVMRSCAWLNEPGLLLDESNCFAGSRTDDVNILDCLCSSRDGCNGSGISQSYLLLIALSSTISLLCFSLIKS